MTIMAPEAHWIAYGGVLIVILFLLPRGIVPAFLRLGSGRRQQALVPDEMAFAKNDAKEPAR